MKRFGLKAIAAALALLMTASLSAPAAAEAADKLLITSAGSNVLVITQDMVDSEGEFVLSGEDFDKVVLPADVSIKNLYVDGCEIGEFTVEGGNNPKVQLWDAQIKNVTVSAPSLVDENKAIAEYLDLYKGKESAEDFDVDGFFKNVRETNERLNSLVPEIRLMGADMESSEQAIGAVTLAGNAKVNFTKGKTPDAVNVAFNSAQMKMDVTIEGYKGDINVDQTTGKENAFGILNIKTKKSEIGNVNVKAQGNANIALRSSDSKAATVNFDSKGDASAVLTVAAPTDNLKVAGSASNATVKVLTSLISADIQGKSITMDLGPAASVETATIAGSGNVVSGSGDLVDCTIAEGSSAAVQIPGAAVAGDNSYQPIISAPSVSGGSSNRPSDEEEKEEDETDGPDLTGATLCTPNQWEVVLFTGEDLREYAGQTVNISVEVIRVGGDSDPVAHGQFNDSNWTAIYYNNKNIGTEWTNYGKLNYVVPETFADEAKAVYYGIRTADGVDYSPYKIYYRNFKVTVAGEEDKEEEITNVDLTGATLCAPTQWEVALFTGEDFREYAGKTVNISVEAVRVGGENDPVAHGQFNDSNWTAIYYGSKSIGTEWTDYGKLNYVVPETFADEAKAVYYGIRTADDVDYSPYKIYYRNFKVEVVGGEEEDNKQDPPAETVTVAINEEDATIALNDTCKFTATVSSGATPEWTSSDTSIATVDANGVVRPVSSGTVTITASVGDASDTVTVEVENAFWLSYWDNATSSRVTTKNLAFTDTTFAESYGNIVAAISANIGLCDYDGGNSFVDCLPESIKSNAELVEKFKTIEGIMEVVKEFEAEVTITAGYKDGMQVQPILQDSSYTRGIYSESAEFTQNGNSYVASKAISTTLIEAWKTEQTNVGQCYVQLTGGALGDSVSGTYSVKAILN